MSEYAFKPPAASECVGPDDVGKLVYDGEQDTWFECIFDARRDEYVWAIVPPVEG